MKNKTIKEHAERLLAFGEGALLRCKTLEAKKRVRKHNKYLKEVIKLGRKTQN